MHRCWPSCSPTPAAASPDATRTVRLEFDHRDDWVRVLTTELANLDLYCDHHHWQKTLEGWQLVAGTGRRAMVPPSDPRHPNQAGSTQNPAPVAPEPTAAPTAKPATSAPRPPERLDDLRSRLDRIHANEAAHQARLAGQGDLFEDTG